MDSTLIPSHLLMQFIENARSYAQAAVITRLETLVMQVLAESQDVVPDQYRVSKKMLIDTFTGLLLTQDITAQRALRAFAAQIHLHLHEDDVAVAHQRLRRAHRTAWCRRTVRAADMSDGMQQAYESLLMATLALVDGDLPAFCGTLSPEAALREYTLLYQTLTQVTTAEGVRLPYLSSPDQMQVLFASACAEPVVPAAFSDWV